MASGFSSSTETSLPSASIDLAIDEPTRPQPTISTNMEPTIALRPLAQAGGSSPPSSGLRGLGVGGRRREDHLAGRLLDHVAGGLARRTGRWCAGSPPRIAPPRMRLGASAASTIASTPRRLASATIAAPAVRPRTIAVATSTPSYSSPTSFARGQRPARPSRPCSGGHARVDRQRHRHLEHVERLEHRAALALLGLLRGQPAGGAHDVVVQRARRRPARGCCRTPPPWPPAAPRPGS